MKPTVSLATPIFNAMPYLEDYLDCVANQTWRPLELIAVDDGSTDDSWECLMARQSALKEAGVSVQAVHREHRYAAAALSAALPYVTGEYFTWCDADDRMTPDSIEKKTEYLIDHPELDMVRSNGIVIDGATGRQLAYSAREGDCSTQNLFDALFHGRTYCYSGCYMIRTELLFACYPEKRLLPFAEGPNLQLLLPPASRSDCGFLPEALHIYCMRSSGDSSRKRSFSELKAKVENFSALRRAMLPYCACDREHYIAEDRKVFEQELQLLYQTAVLKIREGKER